MYLGLCRVCIAEIVFGRNIDKEVDNRDSINLKNEYKIKVEHVGGNKGTAAIIH